MVSGDAGSAARAMPRLAVADMPTNAITKTPLFLRLMIGLLFMNWRRGGRDVDQLDPNEAAFAKKRLTEHCAVCVAVQQNYIAVHFNVKTASSAAPARSP